jgi:hypothetical protein
LLGARDLIHRVLEGVVARSATMDNQERYNKWLVLEFCPYLAQAK